MRELYRIKPLSMLGWWVACSFFVWPLTVIVLGVVAMPAMYMVDALFPNFFTGYGTEGEWFIIAIGVSGAGAVIGICMAFLQRWVLRTKLYWTADRWYLWTAIGGVVGAAVTGLVFSNLEYTVRYDDGTAFFMMPVFLSIVSAFQFMALRNAVKQAWLWIAANIVGGIVYAGVLVGNQPSYMNDYYALITLGTGFLAVASPGLITGFVLLFLFENKLLPLQPENIDDLDNNRPKSVWDKAI